MKILYDISFIVPRVANMSIPIHAMRILENLPTEMQQNFSLLINPDFREEAGKRLPTYKRHYFKTPQISRALKFLKPLLYGRAVKKAAKGCDWILVTDEFRQYTSIRHKGLKKAFLIHDLKGLKRGHIEKHRRFFNKMLKSADLILCISEYTRQDLLSYFPWVDPARTKVLHNSVILSPPAIAPHIKAALPKEFILWVSTLQEYKNILTTLKAFALIAHDTPHSLVVVGRETSYWREVCLPFIAQNGLKDRVVRLHDLDGAALAYLYGHTSLYVTSSTHEGFGFTPIEAAICGAPVVSSKAEALPETTRMLLNYYEPATDSEALAREMKKVLNQTPDPERQALIARTFAEAYSPDRQISTLWSLLRQN